VLSATFDTSAYIGALNSRGFGGRLLALAQAGEIRIDISDAILEETIRVLRDKFAWDGYLLHDTGSGWPASARKHMPAFPSYGRRISCNGRWSGRMSASFPDRWSSSHRCLSVAARIPASLLFAMQQIAALLRQPSACRAA